MVGALGWGLAAVTSLELLGLVGEINRLSIIVFWSLLSVGAIFNLIMQRKNGIIKVKEIGASRDVDFRPQVGDPLYFTLAASAAAIAAITTTVALIAVPSTWDSLSYHLPRIEQWIQQGSLAHFPTGNIRQLASNPAAEMLILHFRLLAESDRLDNLVQALAFIGSIAISALVARRLGASRNGQILAALFTATLPMAILQGSSTQTDLVVSFFLLAAFERLLAWRSSGRILNSIGVGAALGLAILAKGTAYFFAVPLFLFVLGMVIRNYLRQHIYGTVAISVILLMINSGQYYRNLTHFGTPLGPQYGVASLDHSPGALLSTFLRNIGSNLTTPFYRINQTLVDIVVYVHQALGLNVDDPNTTFPITHFNELADGIFTTSEDYAPNPLHLGLIILSMIILFSRRLSSGGSGLCGVVRAYTVTVLLGGILFCLMLRWQPWITRLQLPFFLLMGPAVATVLSTRLRPRLIIIVGVCLAFAALPCVFLNQRRPLWEPPWNLRHRFALGSNILTSDVWEQMFWGSAKKYIAYRNAVKSIADRASGGVGLIVDGDKWEYQLWRMLNENHSTAPVHIEHVCLPENGSARLTFQPEIVLAIKQDPPAILICPNGVFEKEASFPLGDPDGGEPAAYFISVYHRVRTGSKH